MRKDGAKYVHGYQIEFTGVLSYPEPSKVIPDPLDTLKCPRIDPDCGKMIETNQNPDEANN